MSIEDFKSVVARDVESLLNTRGGSPKMVPSQYPCALSSVWSFGLTDFASKSMASLEDRDAICRTIERAISNQESRLTKVSVTIDSRENRTHRLRFNIQALLLVHPLQEPVSFDAELQTTTQNYAVQSVRRPT
jgi:type VI secretion system protein ImpF